MKNTVLYIVFLFFSLVTKAQEGFSVYFDSNKYELKKQENEKLQSFINTNKDVKIVAINGYTDEDGTSGFNDTLAQKRVNFIYEAIKGKLKIRDDFKTRSFGERHKHSKIKAENRKVIIYFLQAKDLPRENEILGIKEEPVVKKPKEMPKYPQKITIQNPNGTSSELVFDVAFMEKLTIAKPGEKLKLDNLNFQLNTFAITNDSRPKIYELLEVMKRNPQMKIQIQGHICCMQNDKQDLSTKRAKAIARFLEINEIDKDRVSYKGFGVTEPLFAIPEKNEEERAANRRVEIEILEN
ncbi:outer membrane protein OmpA-like peptidoglycan-associated protein [Flavobacterium sp. 28YEA47A]|uniref:OmpA family protein n=1 Tax=Flavobacterium sp. 28YEA47A TaxID=3156276 RepID=UPI0035140463